MAIPIISPNLAIPSIAPIVAPSIAPPTGGSAFQSIFTDAVSKVENFQQTAQTSVDNFLAGDGEELHHIAVQSQQAELSFQLFMQVRNKVVAAYNQVMQMQV